MSPHWGRQTGHSGEPAPANARVQFPPVLGQQSCQFPLTSGPNLSCFPYDNDVPNARRHHTYRQQQALGSNLNVPVSISRPTTEPQQFHVNHQQQFMSQQYPQQQVVPQQPFMPQFPHQQFEPQQQRAAQLQLPPHQAAQEQFPPQRAAHQQHSQAPYQMQQQVQFQMYQDEASDQYYYGLPSPWNMRPDSQPRPEEDYLKQVSNGRLMIFNGQRATYSQWRDKFIWLVHMKRTSPAAKALALQASLDRDDPELKALADSIRFTGQGYQEALEDLEAAG